MSGEAATTECRAAVRRIELARRTCIIRPSRIDLRPSRAALIPPLAGFLIGGTCFAVLLASILVWNSALPFFLLALLLVVSLICLPLSGMGVIYAAIGANVVIDRSKQSATWQQGLLGLGVGTTDLVPFWKITAILVEEPGIEEGRPTEEFAQWQIVLLKESGRRLEIGRVTALRDRSAEALGRAREVAAAVAELTGAPLQLHTDGRAAPTFAAGQQRADEDPAPALLGAGERVGARSARGSRRPRPAPKGRRRLR